jgi:hypothetical protein
MAPRKLHSVVLSAPILRSLCRREYISMPPLTIADFRNQSEALSHSRDIGPFKVSSSLVQRAQSFVDSATGSRPLHNLVFPEFRTMVFGFTLRRLKADTILHVTQ